MISRRLREINEKIVQWKYMSGGSRPARSAALAAPGFSSPPLYSGSSSGSFLSPSSRSRACAEIPHRTAKFRYRDYLPVAVLLAAGIAATAGPATRSSTIAERLRGTRSCTRSTSAHDRARYTRTPGSTTFFTT